MLKRTMRTLVRVFLLLGIALLFVLMGFSILLAAVQRSLMYYPERVDFAVLRSFAGQQRLDVWKTPDDRPIGWKRTTSHAEGTFLVFHGNAGHALYRGYLVDMLEQASRNRRFDFYILEYPGYGFRAGTPSKSPLWKQPVKRWGFCKRRRRDRSLCWENRWVPAWPAMSQVIFRGRWTGCFW